MSSQTFSTALFKVVTKDMLGLSATMDGKDGTTKVFKWFLGDIVVAKVESRCEQPVEFRAITFVEKFNESILDYRGSAQNSPMISKLCNYPHRTEFINEQLCAFLKSTSRTATAATAPQAPPECAMCRRNLYYFVKNTCCNQIKYCFAFACERKCPDCKKTWRAEQHYIEYHQNKPLEERHVIVMHGA